MTRFKIESHRISNHPDRLTEIFEFGCDQAGTMYYCVMDEFKHERPFMVKVTGPCSDGIHETESHCYYDFKDFTERIPASWKK